MLNDSQRQFLDRAAAGATLARHPFPRMAACEAALESTFGHSQLAREDNNLFGMKQHAHPLFDTINLPTHEFEKGEWVLVEAGFVKYPSWSDCFADRLATLERLSNLYDPTAMRFLYPHYRAALAASDEATFVTQVSLTWSTDPKRAQKVLDVYRQYTS